MGDEKKNIVINEVPRVLKHWILNPEWVEMCGDNYAFGKYGDDHYSIHFDPIDHDEIDTSFNFTVDIYTNDVEIEDLYVNDRMYAQCANMLFKIKQYHLEYGYSEDVEYDEEEVENDEEEVEMDNTETFDNTPDSVLLHDSGPEPVETKFNILIGIKELRKISKYIEIGAGVGLVLVVLYKPEFVMNFIAGINLNFVLACAAMILPAVGIYYLAIFLIEKYKDWKYRIDKEEQVGEYSITMKRKTRDALIWVKITPGTMRFNGRFGEYDCFTTYSIEDANYRFGKFKESAELITNILDQVRSFSKAKV